MKEKVRVVSLFSGIGAYERALQNIGVETEVVNYCEILKDKSKAYSILHGVPEDRNLVDVTKIDVGNLEDFDMLVYSPPCFGAGTMVTTEQGQVPIEELKRGDKVLTHKGRYRQVLDWGYKDAETVILKGEGVVNTRVTKNHPYYVRKGSGAEWLKVEDLRVGDDLALIRELPNSMFVEHQGEIEGFLSKLMEEREGVMRSKAPIPRNVVLLIQQIVLELKGVNLKLEEVDTGYYNVEYIEEEGRKEGKIHWTPFGGIGEEVTKERVYNIEVEDDNSYTANNIVVHNCQSYSIAGKMQGIEDMRGTLFYNALEVIQEKQPKYCVMENVDNLAQKFKGDFERMLEALELCGYNNYWEIINAKDFIPQNRKRVFVVSIRKDVDKGNYCFPKGEDKRHWFDIIDKADMRELTPRQQRMVTYAKGESEEEIKLEGKVSFDRSVVTLRQSGLRFQSNREYPTITAHYGKGGGNFTMVAIDGEVKGITPRNCFKLMGFEFGDSEKLTKEGFSVSKQYIMAGDSVCVPVLEGIFRNLLGNSKG